MIYLDSSALVKLALTEPESQALAGWLAERADEALVSSALYQTEVLRAIWLAEPGALPRGQNADVHALEHACMLWFGTLLWLAVIGPLPKPRWFAGWWELGYLILVRFLGAVLANALIWAQAVFYPVYRASDAAHGLNPRGCK